MGTFIDLTGQIFGKLTVMKLDHKHSKNGAYWECQCDCGNICIISGKNIKQRNVLSCGCLNKENGIKNRDNLLEQKFGLLTVFDYELNGRNVIWLCFCECGNKKVVKVIGANLKNGKVKSCGCFRRKRLPYGENAFNRLYHTYKTRALNKNFEFTLSKEEFRIITNKRCYYCGRLPFQKASPTIKGFGEYVYNGIDRLDNDLGYTQENSVPCCGFCNVAKNNSKKEDFLEWIKSVYNNIFGEKENE